MKFLAILAVILAMPHFAYAKAYFAPKDQMVAKSDVIAVVKITEVQLLEPGKETGDQLARATVLDVLKGDVGQSKEIEFKVESFFPCAVTKVTTGKFLVFLSREDKQLKGNNWHISYRPITKGTLDWYVNDDSHSLGKKELAEVLTEVRQLVASPWSERVSGLRARLHVLPAAKANSPFCRVFIEMQNVDEVAGQKKIRFEPDRLSLQVTDKEGKKVAAANGPYDGIAPLWEPILLPFAGTTKFQVSFPGLGHMGNQIIDVGSSNAWVIPQDGSTYYLSGSLSIPGNKSDHPYMDWSGVLELPKVAIPKAD